METNRKHWAEKIVKIALSGHKVAIVDDEPVECNHKKCGECDLCDCPCGDCNAEPLKQWGDEPYIPKPLLSGYEAECIRLFIMYNPNHLIGIARWGESKRELDFIFSDCGGCSIDIEPIAFNAMELGKVYTIEELIGK